MTSVDPASGEATVAETAAAETVAPETGATETGGAETGGAETAAAEPAAPKKRVTRTRKKAEPAADAAVTDTADVAAPAEEAPAEPKKRVTRTRKKAEPAADAAADAAADTVDSNTPAQDAPATKPKTRRRVKSDEPQETTAAAGAAAKADTAAADTPVTDAGAADTEAPQTDETKPVRGRRRSSKAVAADTTPAEADAPQAAAEAASPDSAASDTENVSDSASTDSAATDKAATDGETSTGGTSGRARSRSRRSRETKPEAASEATESAPATEASAPSEATSEEQESTDDAKSRQRNGRADANSRQEASPRSSRTRQRDRKRRGQDDGDVEIAEDDVLLPIAGILDVLDNYAFVRTSGYLPGVSDVYVSLGQVKKYGLRRGDAIVGAIRQPREGEGSGRQKYNAIVKIDSVNAKAAEEQGERPDIADMVPVFPQTQLRFEHRTERALGRSIDAFSPIGLGQRALISVPKNHHGSQVIAELASDIAVTTPDAHLMVVLSDAQPEEATALSRSIRGEVVAATFDRLAEDQATIAELAIDRARRLVELGHDVIVLVDSMNRLARGYGQAQPAQHRPALDQTDAHTLLQLKKLLAAARNVENGGSLTVIATIEGQGKTDADKTLRRELLPLANAVLVIDEDAPLAQPVLNAKQSHTRHLDALLTDAEFRAVEQARSLASGDEADELLQRLRRAVTNAALLA